MTSGERRRLIVAVRTSDIYIQYSHIVAYYLSDETLWWLVHWTHKSEVKGSIAGSVLQSTCSGVIKPAIRSGSANMYRLRLGIMDLGLKFDHLVNYSARVENSFF